MLHLGARRNYPPQWPQQVEAVLVAKLDRITRSVSDLSGLLKGFASRHVALVSASESLNSDENESEYIALEQEWLETIKVRDWDRAEDVSRRQASLGGPYLFSCTPSTLPKRDGSSTSTRR